MGVIALHRKVSKLIPELPRLVEETLNELKDYIIELNQQQLADGYRSDGNLMPKYKPISIQIKNAKGKPTFSGRIALYDTGSFWDKMLISIENGKIKFYSTDTKAEMLENEYGSTIYGVGNIYMEALAEKANPILYKKIIDFLKQA